MRNLTLEKFFEENYKKQKVSLWSYQKVPAMDVHISPTAPNSYVEALIPKVMEFGGGGLWEVIRFR